MSTAPEPVSRPAPQKLRLRPGDSELTLEQFLGLSLFKDLTRRAEGRLRGLSGQGAVVLRRYREGDVICREGEAGWTAFYLLKTEDMIWLRQSQSAAADASQELLAIRAPTALSLSAEQLLLEAEAQEGTEGSDEQLISLLRVTAFKPTADELKDLRSENELLSTGDRIEQELEHSHPLLVSLDPAAMRRHADKIATEDTALSRKLQHLAASAEQRIRMQVTVRRKEADATPPPPQPGPLLRIASHLGKLSGRSHKLEPDARSLLAAGPDDAGEVAVATLSEGDLFGELSCLHRAPRSATVRAIRNCYILEFLSVVLELLLTSEQFRADMNTAYRNRVLPWHLRAIPLLKSAPEEVIDQLRRHAELITKQPGDIVFEEGDPADSFYVVRNGTVRVFSRASGRVLGYRSRGEVLGERELLSGKPRAASCAAYEHPTSESSSRGREQATLQLDLVRIDRALFEEVSGRFPAFAEQVAKLSQADVSDHAQAAVAPAQKTARFGELGLDQGRKLLLIDLERCTLCQDCVQACADVHDDRLPRLTLSGQRFGKYVVPTSCRQCRDPVCLIGCPVSAIHPGRAGQIVIEDWCIGCGLCAAQCPYEAIGLRGDGKKGALVCDQCATLPEGPLCVHVCPHEAAQRVDALSFFARARPAARS